MVTVNQLRDYGQKLQDTIAAINYNLTVIDDSQIVRELDEISPENKHLLYLIIPSHSNEGKDDELMTNNKLMFLVLQKCDSSITHDEFLDVIHSTQATVRAVELQMLRDKEDQCGLMVWLKGNSININPMWGFAGCHGWSIDFSMETNL